MALIRWSLEEARQVPPSPAATVLDWGPALILAPHPDDEALGCGGLAALLRGAGRAVSIVWLTNGAQSHPNSQKFPRAKLIKLRQTEALAAAESLGVTSCHFLHLEDTVVPLPPEESIVAALRELLRPMRTVFTPWRLDPHGDHRAAHAYVLAAAQGLPVQVIEYPIWVWQSGAPEDHPSREAFTLVRLDITETLPAKKRAIAAHPSQFTDLIDDDPAGFRVPATMRAHFEEPWELYLIGP